MINHPDLRCPGIVKTDKPRLGLMYNMLTLGHGLKSEILLLISFTICQCISLIYDIFYQFWSFTFPQRSLGDGCPPNPSGYTYILKPLAHLEKSKHVSIRQFLASNVSDFLCCMDDVYEESRPRGSSFRHLQLGCFRLFVHALCMQRSRWWYNKRRGSPNRRAVQRALPFIFILLPQVEQQSTTSHHDLLHIHLHYCHNHY